ncbi:hypothetical protein Y032_0769g2203 [Ancylostoma ceylanicum]|uniref:Uncharacterized protein n=1 Tax=Ancylostoma ceylanicum TaxID=53326 RepID=A0A016WFF0_9BILA|nr:hypothetical protein Y032_0769g2203 [Ancylostoma ceylanicum]
MIEGAHGHTPPIVRPTDGVGTTTGMSLGRGPPHAVIGLMTGKNGKEAIVIALGVPQGSVLIPPAIADRVQRTNYLVIEM